jgi:hypothetical protein
VTLVAMDLRLKIQPSIGLRTLVATGVGWLDLPLICTKIRCTLATRVDGVPVVSTARSNTMNIHNFKKMTYEQHASMCESGKGNATNNLCKL